MMIRPAMVLPLLLLAPRALPEDADVARFLFGKAQKSYRAKNYEEAEKLYRRALDELPTFSEAAYGLGQALEKLGRAQEAIRAYRRCIDICSGCAEPTSRQRTVATKAGRAITRLRRRFAALDKLNRDFIRRCLAFGKKYAKSDPAWARKALEAVLALDPANDVAKSYLAGLPADGKAGPPRKPPEKKPGKTWGEPLIMPDDLSAWSPGESDEWSVSGPIITGDVRGRDGKINWLDNLKVDGKYEVRFRFRVRRDGGARRTVGFFIGDGKDYWWALMLDDDDSLVLLRYANGTNTPSKERALGEFDAARWHTIRIEVDRCEAKFHLDDEKMFEVFAERRQAFEGKFAFFVQNAKVEFQDLELKR